MINKFALGFAAVAAFAVTGVDYISQAQALGKEPGEFSVTDYTRSVTSRLGTLISPVPVEAEALAKTDLPDASKGVSQSGRTPENDGVSDNTDMSAIKETLTGNTNENAELSDAKQLIGQGEKDGNVSEIDENSTGKSEVREVGVKRLNLNPDACRTSSVGKFCGTK